MFMLLKSVIYFGNSINSTNTLSMSSLFVVRGDDGKGPTDDRRKGRPSGDDDEMSVFVLQVEKYGFLWYSIHRRFVFSFLIEK